MFLASPIRRHLNRVFGGSGERNKTTSRELKGGLFPAQPRRRYLQRIPWARSSGVKRQFSKSLPGVPDLGIPRIFPLGALRPNLVCSGEDKHEEKTDVDGDRRNSGGDSSACSL
jgi:hypothetical protein